ncbi:MAG: zf-HC2 domain-containing protein [Acidobacteriota bacterium]
MSQDEWHPSDDAETLEAYLADRLGAGERHELQSHLADCDRCRAGLVAFHDQRHEAELASPPIQPWLDRARNPGRRRLRVSRSLLLAAGLATAVLGGLLALSSSTPSPPPTVLESDTQVFRLDDPVQTLQLISPLAGALLPPGPVDLQWTPVVDARQYRVFLLDHAGIPITTHRTDATRWRWTEGNIAEFWYVEAELADGTRIESEARQLTFAPVDVEGRLP